jgi:hypothetical protein
MICYPKLIITYFDNCRIKTTGKKYELFDRSNLGANLEHIICNNEKLKENNDEKNHRPDFSGPVFFELRPPGQYDRRRERKISSIK